MVIMKEYLITVEVVVSGKDGRDAHQALVDFLNSPESPVSSFETKTYGEIGVEEPRDTEEFY